MNDPGLSWNTQAGAADFAIQANDLAQDGGLETAVMLSLFTDRRAEDGDVLPDAEKNRRGWWGDTFPVVEGDRFGSRLWLLARSKDTKDVLSRAPEYAKESLQWLLDDKVASQVDVAVDRGTLSGRDSAIVLTITIHRPQVDAVTYRYNYTWASQEARRA
jgi:phage gp46-like protein